MSGNDQTVLRIPPRLQAKISKESEESDVSWQAIILKRLFRSYRLKEEPPKQGWKKGVARKPQ